MPDRGDETREWNTAREVASMHVFADLARAQTCATNGSAPPRQTFVVFRNSTRLFKVVTASRSRKTGGIGRSVPACATVSVPTWSKDEQAVGQYGIVETRSRP